MMKKYQNRTSTLKSITFVDGSSQFLMRGQFVTTDKPVISVQPGVTVVEVKPAPVRKQNTAGRRGGVGDFLQHTRRMRGRTRDETKTETEAEAKSEVKETVPDEVKEVKEVKPPVKRAKATKKVAEEVAEEVTKGETSGE